MAGGKSGQRGDRQRGKSVTIIRRTEDGGGGGHHGGAWKVAYADFVTAMMAFFLLMWLLNATTEAQRKGLADYFTPSNLLSHANSGNGEPFGGRTPYDTAQELSDNGAVTLMPGRKPPPPPNATRQNLHNPSSRNPAARAAVPHHAAASAGTAGAAAGAVARNRQAGAPSGAGRTSRADAAHGHARPHSPPGHRAREAYAGSAAAAAGRQAADQPANGKRASGKVASGKVGADQPGTGRPRTGPTPDNAQQAAATASQAAAAGRQAADQPANGKRASGKAASGKVGADQPGTGRPRTGPTPDNAQQAAATASQAAAAAGAADRAAAEQAAFHQAAASIRAMVASHPGLAKLAGQLAIDITPQGLRIQIMDEDRRPMFATGSAVPQDWAAGLLAQIVPILRQLPEGMAISGYTDAAPYHGTGRSNWDLSADRANAVRRLLTGAGLPQARILSVTGRADRDLLLPADPLAAANRRITILVRRDAPRP